MVICKRHSTGSTEGRLAIWQMSGFVVGVYVEKYYHSNAMKWELPLLAVSEEPKTQAVYCKLIF